MKEGTAPTIAGGNENFVSPNDGSGGIGTVTGFPFFKGECLAIASMEDDQAVGLEHGDMGIFSTFKRNGRAIGWSIALTFPDNFSRNFIEGEGGPGFNQQ